VAQSQSFSRPGGWEGNDVRDEWNELRFGQSWCVIPLDPVRGPQRCCSGCGRSTAAVHDLEERRVRDPPVFEHRVELIVPPVRVECPACGPKLERLSWLEPYARVTHRLDDSVARLCKAAAILHVARLFCLDWQTDKDLDRASLERQLGPVDLDGLEVIAMDEFAIQKAHRYATVIVEPTHKRVLGVCRGRARGDVRPFFLALGPERCARLKAAVMERSSACDREVRLHCPTAAIVFDLFHVGVKYRREVIDRVRVDCANELRADRRGRQIVEGARWLMLKNRESLRPGKDGELAELVAANHALFVVYVVRDALKDLWSYRHPGYAARAWNSW
jgi:transposase